MLKRIGDTKVGELRAIASGTLTNGKPVVINSDGTCSVAGTVAQNVGSGNTFHSGRAFEHVSVYDSYNKRIVIAYQDDSDSKKGTVIVGSVSGNIISFGTPVQYKSDEEVEYTSMVFDSTNNRIVIIYRDDIVGSPSTFYGVARVGTVDPSDNSISLGTKAVFNSNSTNYINSCFDSTNGKVVIFFRNNPGSWNNANRSNSGIVGTVNPSDNSITFGTKTNFGSGSVFYNSITSCDAIHDPDNNKIIMVYNDGNPSNDPGYAVVCTISGTTISYGTPVVFAENGNSQPSSLSVVYNSQDQRIVISYYHRTAIYGANISMIAGTVSGDSITFGSSSQITSGGGTSYGNYAGSSPSIAYDVAANKILLTFYLAGTTKAYYNVVTVDPSDNSLSFSTAVGSGNSPFGVSLNGSNNSYVNRYSNQLVYDSDNKVIIVPYRDNADNDDSKALVFTNSRVNMTAENFVGISASGAANGAGSIIDSAGAIADNLSGLTAGQSYYVQTDGTLGLTADSPSVFAGTAVSATKLIVKG